MFRSRPHADAFTVAQLFLFLDGILAEFLQGGEKDADSNDFINAEILMLARIMAFLTKSVAEP